jgi:hypothetical protein
VLACFALELLYLPHTIFVVSLLLHAEDNTSPVSWTVILSLYISSAKSIIPCIVIKIDYYGKMYNRIEEFMILTSILAI